MSSKNLFRKLYKKLKRMAKLHNFTVMSMHNIPHTHKDGGIIEIKIKW